MIMVGKGLRVVKPKASRVFPLPSRREEVGSDGATFEYIAYEHYDGVADVEVDSFTSNPSHCLLRSRALQGRSWH
jgi:hypothetical protein